MVVLLQFQQRRNPNTSSCLRDAIRQLRHYDARTQPTWGQTCVKDSDPSSQLRPCSTMIIETRKNNPPAPLLHIIPAGRTSHPCWGERKSILAPLHGVRPQWRHRPPKATHTVVAHKPRVSTRSEPLASNDPQESRHFIPTLRQFLQVGDENDFMGLAGNDNGEEVKTLAEWLASFLLHPEVFECLGGAKEIRAQEAAFIIIQATSKPTAIPKTRKPNAKGQTVATEAATKRKAKKPTEHKMA
jgi:hypothetical protein